MLWVIADILRARGQLDEALKIRKKEELPVYERVGDVRSRAVTMGKVADILQARGQLDEALKIHKEEVGSAGSVPVSAKFLVRKRRKNASARRSARRCPAARCSAKGRQPRASTRAGQLSWPCAADPSSARSCSSAVALSNGVITTSRQPASAPSPRSRALITSAPCGAMTRPDRRQSGLPRTCPHSRCAPV